MKSALHEPLDKFYSVEHIIYMKQWTPEAIKALRKKLDLTQEKFAPQLGVHKSYISMLEHGTKKPGKILTLLLDCIARQHKEDNHGTRHS